jgi:hypothetical protein
VQGSATASKKQAKGFKACTLLAYVPNCDRARRTRLREGMLHELSCVQVDDAGSGRLASYRVSSATIR